MKSEGKYYEINRVIDKELFDRAMFGGVFRMAGQIKDPKVIALTRLSKDLFPIVYYTSVDNISRSPLKGEGVSAYTTCPPSIETLGEMSKIGVRKLFVWNQFYTEVLSPKALNFDAMKWYARYSEFRAACMDLEIDLLVSRNAWSGYFLAPLYGGLTASNRMVLSSTKRIKMTTLLDENFQFPASAGKATHPDYIIDHIRPEEIQLMADSDMKHIAGYAEHNESVILVLKTTVVSRRMGHASWTIRRYREPLAKRGGLV